MKQCYLRSFTVSLFSLIACSSVQLQAQISVPASTLVTENFNAMAAGLTLPANWKVSAAGGGTASQYGTGLGVVTQAANSGTPTTGGGYNWGTTPGTDRAVGFMTDAVYTSDNSIMAFYQNTTVSTTLTVSFAIERYRINGSAFSLSFSSSANGTAWIAQPAGDISSGLFAAGASSYTFGAPVLPQTIYKSFSITIPASSNFYLRWIFTTPGNINSQGLGLDNVAVYVGAATPVITAKLRDALTIDNPPLNQANPGDRITYTNVIKNIGSGDATNVLLTNPAPAQTTYVGGSLKTSSLAKDESYTTPLNTALNVAVGSGVLLNDFGMPAPTVLSFGPSANPAATAAGSAGTSDNGGTLTVNANGSFNYTPPAGFTGIDKFAYIAGNGNLPNNDAIVTISVQSLPIAIADPNGGLPANSTPPAGANPNPYHGAINTVITVPDGPNDLLANDNLGFPVAAIVSYGVTGIEQTTLGSATPTLQGGTVSVFADGHFTYSPPSSTFTGLDAFAYKLQNAAGSSTAAVTVAVGLRPTAAADNYSASGNIAIALNQAGGVVLGTGTDGGDQIIVTQVQGLAGNVGVATATTATGRGGVAGSVTLAANGSFTYEPPPGFVGNDMFTYTVGNGFGNSGAATVTIMISNMVWFINNNAGGSNRGTFSNPFTTIAAFNTANAATGVAPDPKNGDLIAFRTGSGTYTEADGINLRDNQKLFGEAVQFNTVFTANTNSIAAYNTFASGTNTAPSIVTNSGTNHGVDLAQNNTVRGLNVGTTTGFGFNGTAVGSPVINTVSKTGNGGAISVSTSGAFSTNVTFDILSSTNSASQGINLVGVTGTLAVTTGSITNPTGTAVNVNGGSVGMTYPGNITQINNASTVSVSGGHTGTLTFQTGTINVSNGNGLQFNNADGSYNFNGTTTLNGSGDEGIDILDGSSGTFNFGTGAAITSPSGIAFNISGTASTCGVIYSGSITYATPGVAMVNISGGHNSGTITFQTGTLSATSGTGLQFDNADGTYNFNGTTTLNGGDAGVDIINGSAGGFTFGTGAAITSPAGIAFNVDGTAATITSAITYSGAITQANNFAMVNVKNHNTGTITFQTGTLSATNGTGLQFDNADSPTSYNFNGTTTLNGGDAGIDILTGSGGTFNFASGSSINNPTGIAFNVNSSPSGNITYSGTFNKTNSGIGIQINAKNGGTVTFDGSGTKTLSTTTSTAINLTNNTGATINFSGNNLLLTTTSGTGFNATGGGTVSVAGTSNTITSVGGAALNVVSTTIGASDLNFQSISANGGANGIVLNTTGSSGGLIVTGDGGSANNSTGGTIQNNSADGISLTSTQDVSLDQINIQSSGNNGINGTTVTNFTLTNSTINNSGNTAFESNIAFNTSPTTASNIAGTLTITGCTLTNAYYSGLDIQAGDGTITNANISSNIITSTTSTATSQGFGININGVGTTTTAFALNNATISSNTITNFPTASGIQINGGNANATGPRGTIGIPSDPTNLVSITSNTIQGASIANRMGGSAIIVAVIGGNNTNATTRSRANINISSNPTLTNIAGTVIGVACNGHTTMTATVNNNVIVANQQPNFGGANGIGGGCGIGGGGTAWVNALTMTVMGNNISQTDGNGILLVNRATNGNMDLKIANNTVSTPINAGGTARQCIRVDAGNNTAGEDAVVCLRITGNICSIGSNGAAGIGIRKQGTIQTTNEFGIIGLAPSPATGPQAAAYVVTQNPAGNGCDNISGSNFQSCSTAPARMIENR